MSNPGQSPTEQQFRSVLGRFATGVSIMTALADDEPHGMTASALCSVSLDPPLVLVCVDRGTVMAEVAERADGFALSFLAEDQAHWSQWFADATRPSGHAQFDGVDIDHAVTGSPIIKGAVGWVDCRIWARYDGGDHVILVGEAVALDQTTADATDGPAPLLYHRGRYAALGSRPTSTG